MIRLPHPVTVTQILNLKACALRFKTLKIGVFVSFVLLSVWPEIDVPFVRPFYLCFPSETSAHNTSMVSEWSPVGRGRNPF